MTFGMAAKVDWQSYWVRHVPSKRSLVRPWLGLRARCCLVVLWLVALAGAGCCSQEIKALQWC